MTQETNHDLSGKTIAITGATAGIGLAALRELAGRGAHVIGVGRSAEKCAGVRTDVLAEHPGARLSFVVADLASQRQVRALAVDIRERLDGAAGAPVLDVLINNAGTVASWYMATEDGYELQFAVNHLAPFLLTHELLPALRGPKAGGAESGRVLTVSSGSHRGARIRWQDVMMRQGYGVLAAYKQSKLANVLFSAEFNRRMAGSGVRAYAVDPGLVNTEIGLKGTSGVERLVWSLRRRGGVSPAEGASTLVYLASEPSPGDALYWKDCAPVQPSDEARSAAEAARLWALSERLCGIASPVPAARRPALAFVS
jgi:NAD(P)-dependent dehydrogenase (short-subunit alcohol dehydrogenase family)